MHALVNIALRAARDAGETLARASERLDRVEVIRDDAGGFLTSMDEAADRTIMYHLQKAYPEYGILSRVSGHTEGKRADFRWLIDPLAGSRNFVNGHSQFAVSIACQVEGVVSHGVLLNPLLREEFIASRGAGARLNDRRIRAGTKTDMKNALIGLNPATLDSQRFLAMQGNLLAAGASPRLSGCSALDMAYVACGRLSAGWCGNGGLAANAAASLILRETGGFIADEKGGPETHTAAELIFGNPKLFRELVRLRAGIS